jgi:uncharacterized paraquat-inducible protein A
MASVERLAKDSVAQRLGRLGRDGRLLAALTCQGGCGRQDHATCARCGADVCLGMLNDLQRSRALGRGPVLCGACTRTTAAAA